MQNTDTPEPLNREIGLFSATAIGIGAVIGAGIFLVTGISAGLAGPAVILSILVAGTIAYFTAVSFSKLSAYIPKEGGAYAFAYELISPTAGFFAGWMWILSYTFAGAAVALGFANYLAQIIPVIHVKIVAVAICLAFTLLNHVGIKESVIVNNILVLAKIMILFFFIALGVFFISPTNFTPFFIPTNEWGTLQATALIFFAYIGFARITTIAEEVENPSRTIPKAIILTLIISIVFYALTGFVAVGLVGYSALAGSDSPLALAIAVTSIPTAVFVVSVGAIIATASVLLTAILGVSRVAFAMARNRDLPSFLERIDKKRKTPYKAVWFAGLLMTAAVVLTPNLAQVVALSSFASLLYYSLANVAAINLSTKTGKFSPLIPFIGLISCLSLLVFLSLESWLIGIVTLVLGTAYYYLRRKNMKNMTKPEA
ncbi:MAG: APC family permease [Candidatus Bathyarchaeales archaeon]